MSQRTSSDPALPTSSARSIQSTHSTTGPFVPPRQLPGSQVYRLPVQATPNAPGPLYAIRSGAIMGIFTEWSTIEWALKAEIIQQSYRPTWRKFQDWNQAVHYMKTGDVGDIEVLAGPPSHPPPVRVQPEQVMADIFAPGSVLLAPAGSIVCPFVGSIGPPPQVQIVVSRFDQVDTISSSPPLNRVPLRDDNAELLASLSPTRQQYNPVEPLLPPSGPPSPVPTLVSTTAADYDVFMAPSLSGSSSAGESEHSAASRTARWAAGPGPIRGFDTTPTPRRTESDTRSRQNARSQPATPISRLRLTSFGVDASPEPTPTFTPDITAEAEHRLRILRMIGRQPPSSERQIECALVFELLVTGGFRQSWLRNLAGVVNSLIASRDTLQSASGASSSASGSNVRR